jgi:hypothetical protein
MIDLANRNLRWDGPLAPPLGEGRRVGRKSRCKPLNSLETAMTNDARSEGCSLAQGFNSGASKLQILAPKPLKRLRRRQIVPGA